MMNPNDATEVVPYLTSAATIVYIQEWLKQRQVYAQFVQAFPGTDKWAHWAVAGVMSLVAAAGIHWVWTGSLTNGGVLTIQIPDLTTVAHGVADWFKVYVLQHTVYKMMREPQWQPPTPPPSVPTPPQGGH